MTLPEAILHLEETLAKPEHFSCEECRAEHEQLLEWLKELQFARELIPSINADIKALREYIKQWVPKEYQPDNI